MDGVISRNAENLFVRNPFVENGTISTFVLPQIAFINVLLSDIVWKRRRILHVVNGFVYIIKRNIRGRSSRSIMLSCVVIIVVLNIVPNISIQQYIISIIAGTDVDCITVINGDISSPVKTPRVSMVVKIFLDL